MTQLEMSPNLLSLKKHWESITKEFIKVDRIENTIYGFGSELAVLRLLKVYRLAKNTRALYSHKLRSWVFCLDVGTDFEHITGRK